MSQELEPVDDHAEDALTLLPEQFKRKENFEAFVTAFVNVVQDTEDMLQALWQGRFLDNAIGSQLDGLGSIVGEERGSLEDDDYRVRIRVRGNGRGREPRRARQEEGPPKAPPWRRAGGPRARWTLRRAGRA